MPVLLLLSAISTGRGAETFEGHTFYYGDIHAHTGISPDGGSLDLGDCSDDTVCLPLASVFDTAKSNGLDFLAVPDYSSSDETAYDSFLAEVLAANDDTFVTIPAMELRFTHGTDKIGHKNIYVFQDDDALLEGLSFASLDLSMYVGSCDDVFGHAADVAAAFGPTLEFAHHPATGIYPTDWTCHDQTYEPVVEVYSGVGNSLDYDSSFDSIFDKVESGTVHEALETYGLEVGFVAGTDIHDTRPGEVCDTDTEWVGSHVYGGGLTVVVLDEGVPLVRSAIYDEMVARRTMVTTGPRVPVVAEWFTTDGLVHDPGDNLRVRRGDESSAMVRVPDHWEAEVTQVALVGYSTRIALSETSPGMWESTLVNNSLPSWLYVEVAIDGATHYGGAGACADGGTDDQEFVWSSPVWFEPTADVDGDGHPFRVDCDDDDPTIHPFAREIIADGIDQDCNGRDKLRPGPP